MREDLGLLVASAASLAIVLAGFTIWAIWW
jgi:hypothetical protein